MPSLTSTDSPLWQVALVILRYHLAQPIAVVRILSALEPHLDEAPVPNLQHLAESTDDCHAVAVEIIVQIHVLWLWNFQPDRIIRGRLEVWDLELFVRRTSAAVVNHCAHRRAECKRHIAHTVLEQ